MQQTIERDTVNTNIVSAMRLSGATLRQIAHRIGRSKERVRQILESNHGSTKHQLISTEQLCKVLNLSRRTVLGLYQDGVIIPAREWSISANRYLLWYPDTIEQVNAYYTTRRLCKICHSPVPKNRRQYCSEQCYRESHKYKYKSIEAKHRQMESIRRYREKRKQLAAAIR